VVRAFADGAARLLQSSAAALDRTTIEEVMSCVDAVTSAVDDLSETECAEAEALAETARKIRERADKEETRVAAFARFVHRRRPLPRA
jgi:hypothetical protein